MPNSHTNSFNDSCILFIINSKLKLGFIRSVVRINRTKQYSYLFQVQLVTINSYLQINLDGKVICNKNVILGNLDSYNTHVYIKPQQIIEKIIHVYDKHLKQFIFFRFPNLVESS